MTENFVCVECGFEIPVRGKYMKNDKDGTVLCLSCFQKFVKEGKIK